MVSGNKVARVGSNREAIEGRGHSTEIVDLRDKTLLPGFIDTHVHLIATGLSKMGPRLEGCETVADVLAALAEEALRQQTIVRASGLDPSRLREGRFPTRQELDSIVPDKFLYVVRRDGHSVLVNTRTLAHLSLPDDTPGLDRDPIFNQPTGVLKAQARQMAGDRLTLIDDSSRNKAIDLALQEALEVGITTVHALDGGWERGEDDIKALLAQADQLPVNVIVYYQTTDVDKVLEMGLPRIGGCLLVDGSLGSQTAALSVPYADKPDSSGELYYTNEDLLAFALRAHKAGLQISMHAIGDRAIDQLLRVYQQVLEKYPRADHRHRIEHFLLPTEEHIAQASRLNVHVAMQPAFMHFWERGGNLYRQRLGEERMSHISPLAKVIDAGIVVGGGSDSFITPMNPLLGIHSAVNDHPEDRRVDVNQALRMFTIDAARLAFEEGEKGSITSGKLADLVVLEENPLEVEPSNIKDIPVRMVIVRGEVRKGP